MKATCTISWLGLEADGSREGIAYADKLSKTYRRHMAERKLVTLTPEEQKEDVQMIEVKLGDPRLEAMLRLLDRPYFERAWIVQEVTVSRQVYFMCGTRDCFISWEALLGAFLFLIQVHPWVWEFYSGNRISKVVEMRLSEMDWETSIVIDWPRALLRHRWCLSGDARDKVFAFYGLRCKRTFEELDVRPNYDLPASVLYTQLAARALKKGQVAVLLTPRLVIGKEQEDDEHFEKIPIPSWVPDWRSTGETPASLINAEGIANRPDLDPDYRAAKDSAFHATFDNPSWNTHNGDFTATPPPTTLPKLIKLSGFTFAKVTCLTRRPWEHQKPTGRQTLVDQAAILQFNQHQVHEWEAVLRPASSTLPQTYTPTGESGNTAMYETLMAGSSIHRAAAKDAAAAFERRQRFLRVIHILRLHGFLFFYIVVVLAERVFRLFGYMNPEVQFRSMVGHMTNRKGAQMISTSTSKSKGDGMETTATYLALVPGICKLGDHVVLVEGVRVPLILRSTGEEVSVLGDGEERRMVRTWELIGDSYVHGVMKGEMWDRTDGECEDFWIA